MRSDAGTGDNRRVYLKRVELESPEVIELQGVLERVPTYSRRVTGCDASPTQAVENLEALPPGKTMQDKFGFGVCTEQGKMIGFVDLIRGFPNPETAMLGLLVISEELQGQGYGAKTCREIERIVRSWSGVTKVRISVVGTNDQVLMFWQKMGFVLTGERKPYESRSVVSESIVLEKVLLG